MAKRVMAQWNWFQFFWAVLVIVVLPNSIISIFSLSYGLERPYVNVDYAIVMLIFILNRRVLGVVALVLAFFFDILALVGQIFPVLRFSDLPYMSKFIGVAPFGYKVSLVFLFFILIVFVYLFLFKHERRSNLEFLLCVNIIIIIYGIISVFGSEKAAQVWSSEKRSVVSSQVVFGIESRRTGFTDSMNVDGEIFGEHHLVGASNPWIDDLSGLDEKVLLIINESWGVSSPEVHSAILAPLSEKSDLITDWREGVIEFSGITIGGEIRELCQADLLHFNFEGHEKELSSCLPNRLKRLGYKTASFHGAAGLMYDRAKWYPQVGFDKTTFLESYSWPKRCYSFPGACDSDMAEHISEFYSAEGSLFGYWLTLNTHHKYDLRDLEVDGFSCENIGVDADGIVCRNLKLQHQFFSILAGIVSDPNMKDVRVLVVADHEPRIFDKSEMEKYFEKGLIPWLSFKIK